MRTVPLADSRTAYAWLAAATPLVAAAFSIAHMARSVFVPYELDYGEGLVLWESLRITNPQVVYHPIETSPFVVAIYPPGYLLAAHFAGAAIGDIQIGGRLVTLVATLLCAVMVAAIVLELLPARLDRRARWIGALTAGALALSLANVRRWGPLARVDILGVALSLSGLFLFLNGRRYGWKWYAAFTCFALAAFTKQNLIAGAAACLVVAAFESRRAAAALAAFYALLVAGSFGVMQAITGGQFLQHLFFYPAQNPFYVMQVIEMGALNLGAMSPLLIPACLAVSMAMRRPARHATKAIGLVFRNGRLRWGIGCLALFVGMAVLASATSGKKGAGPYYFIEWNVACCALVGVLIGVQLARWNATRSLWRLTVPLCVGAFGFVAAGFESNQALHFTAGARALDRQRLTEYREAVQVVRSLPDPVLGYDLTLMVKGGKEAAIEPFMMYTLHRAGRWDAAPLVDQVSRRTYSAFVGDTDLDFDGNMPDAMKEAIRANYPTVLKVGHYRFRFPDGSTGIGGTKAAVPSIPIERLP